MVHETSFLSSLAAVLGVAAATTLVCQRLKLPLILGYLLAGILIGPYTPPFALADPGTVTELSELGLILLMYSIGLELSFRDLARIGWRGAAIAITGFGITFWLGSLIAAALGFSGLLAVFIAASLCISSTMLIARTFEEQRVPRRIRETVFGVLVIEDIIAILMLALLTTLATSRSFDPADLLRTAGRLLGFLLALGLFGALVVPRLLRWVARTGQEETLLVTAIGICFLAALGALSMGYSVALGAFIAGSISAESGHQERLHDLLKPLVNLFGAVFFVAAGMSIDPRLLLEYWHLVLAFLPVVLFGKMLGVTLGFFATGKDVRTSIQSGLSMAQTGEFAFIIAALGAQVGAAVGAEGRALMPIAAGVAALSMLITPYAIRFAPRIASAIDAGLPRRMQTFVALYGSWIERIGRKPGGPDEGPAPPTPRLRRLIRILILDAVLLTLVVVCAGLLGDDVKRLLRNYTELALTPARWLVYGGFALLALPIAYGLWRTIAALGQELALRALPRVEADQVDFAQAPRRAFIVSLQLGLLVVISLPVLALTQPFVPGLPGAALLAVLLVVSGLAFWRSTGELQAHARAGASAVLDALGQLAGTRRQIEADDQLEPAAPNAEFDALEQLLPGLGEFTGITLADGSRAVGRSLATLNLRGLTGATVLAIRRADAGVLTPEGREVLVTGDVLVLAGSHEALEAARELLEGTSN